MSAYPGTLNDAVSRVQAEAGGLLALHIVRIQDVPNLLGGALSGHADAAHLLTAVNDLLHRIGQAPASRPMQCACCGSDLQPGRFALAIATPDIADPSAGLGMAICRRCGTTLGAIKAAALKALRGFWPDGRFIEVTHPDGDRA